MKISLARLVSAPESIFVFVGVYWHSTIPEEKETARSELSWVLTFSLSDSSPGVAGIIAAAK